LAMPWRAASRLMVGLCYGLAGRRQPLALLCIVVVTAVVIAVDQAVQQGHWAVAAVLSGVIVCAVVCPLADASRRRLTVPVSGRGSEPRAGNTGRS